MLGVKNVQNDAIASQGSASESELKPVPLVNDQRHASHEGKFQMVVLGHNDHEG